MKVHRRHMRMAGLCASGGRKWFEVHGLNWSEFLAEGIDAETLRATGDALAIRVVELAEREAGNG